MRTESFSSAEARDISQYQLFCFDVDDTLVSTYRHVTTTIYPRLAKSVGSPPPDEGAVRACWGEPLDESLKQLLSPKASIDTCELLETLRSLHAAAPVPVVERARVILNTLKRHGRRIAVYSSGDKAIVRHSLIRVLGLPYDATDDDMRQSCDALYLFSEANQSKEDPGALDGILQEVEERTGKPVSTSDTLVVGDDVRDFKLTKESDAGFRALTTGACTKSDHIGVGVPATHIFESLSEAFSLTKNRGVVAVIRDSKDRFLLVREGREDNPFYGKWSGPHGRCEPEDILEEETVVRETREEVGIDVRPVRCLHVREADTKVKDVAFWLAEQTNSEQAPRIEDPGEISAIGWFPLSEILQPEFPLYDGTRDFFQRMEWEGIHTQR